MRCANYLGLHKCASIDLLVLHSMIVYKTSSTEAVMHFDWSTSIDQWVIRSAAWSATRLIRAGFSQKRPWGNSYEEAPNLIFSLPGRGRLRICGVPEDTWGPVVHERRVGGLNWKILIKEAPVKVILIYIQIAGRYVQFNKPIYIVGLQCYFAHTVMQGIAYTFTCT